MGFFSILTPNHSIFSTLLAQNVFCSSSSIWKSISGLLVGVLEIEVPERLAMLFHFWIEVFASFQVSFTIVWSISHFFMWYSSRFFSEKVCITCKSFESSLYCRLILKFQLLTIFSPIFFDFLRTTISETRQESNVFVIFCQTCLNDVISPMNSNLPTKLDRIQNSSCAMVFGTSPNYVVF